jgi:hypothetical protein
LVTNSRKTKDSGPLRPLNLPVPVKVRVNRHYRPLYVVLDRKVLRIDKVHEFWIVDREWWRPQRTRRWYYRVATKDWREMTIFWDRVGGQWYRQRA